MAAPKLPDYRMAGGIDRAVFQAEFASQFSKSARYSAAAMPDTLVLLGLIEADASINDVRWAAYILATAMWETTSPTTVTRPALNKKGQPLLDKKTKAPIILKERKWLMTMAPVDEVGHGKGRKYHEPVKVSVQADGSVRIAEQDGDQFKVSAAGIVTALTKGAVMGTTDGGAATKSYDGDDGAEQAFYGRGYVQLTWWSNYAKAGVAIGRGLDLLTDPELVKTPEIAYALMSHGMTTGEGFANGHKLSQYFNGTGTNYVGARRMVNGQDHAADIAAIAGKFEAILLKARRTQAAPAVVP